MAEITIVDWEAIEDTFRGKSIAQLERVDVVTASIRTAPKVAVRGVDLVFGAAARLSIDAFRDARDEDDAQIVGIPGASLPDGTTLDPKLPWGEEKAWLRYSIAGELTASVKARLGNAGVNLDAASQIVFSDYHLHAPADPAAPCVLADLAAMRSPLIADDVLALGAGEALVWETRGDLLFSVKVSWSDVYARVLSELSALLPSSRTFAIEIAAGASASFAVTLTDDFVLMFWRDAGAQMHVGVRKASSRGTVLAAGVSVKAGFANAADMTKAADRFLESYLGTPLRKAEQILTAATGGTLTGARKEIFGALMKALGLEPLVQKAWEAKQRLGALRDGVAKRLQEAAGAEIAAAWKYEYSRVESTRCVVEAGVSDAQLEALHDSLKEQRLTKLLEMVQSGRVSLTKYLDETTLVRARSTGFSLGIGKWFHAGNKDEAKLTIRTRRSLDRRHSMVSYIGARSFGDSGSWGLGEYAFDFRAEMSGWAIEPRAADFEFGLAMTMTTTPHELTDDAIASILDTASLWSITASGTADVVPAKLTAIRGRTATARFELKFSEEVLRQQLATRAGVRDEVQMAGALAAAMPWAGTSARSAWRTRARLYAPAWYQVLHNQVPAAVACAAVEHAVRTEDAGTAGLDRLETPAALTGVVRLNPGIAADYRMWVAGMSLLAEAVGPGTMASQKIETAFRDLYSFFSRAFYVRAIGRYLVSVAASLGQLGNVGRALTVSYHDGPGERHVTIGSRV